MKQIHPIQIQILKKLLFAPELRYSDLRPDLIIENNQLDFHLDKLVLHGWVTKKGASYHLTSSGKEYADRIDTDRNLITKQAKVSAWIASTRQSRKDKQFLIYTRLKQPFFGCQGFLGGKIRFGEKIIKAAEREFTEETGLHGKAAIVSLKHFRIFDKSSKALVADKFMFLCLVKNPTGALLSENIEGKYEWVNMKDLKTYLTNPFEPLSETMGFVQEIEKFSGVTTIKEVDHYTK